MKVLYIILLFALCSCGTSKRSTETEGYASANLSQLDSLIRKDSAMSLEQFLSSERLRAHIIITEWSKPDSVGNQYQIKTTDVNLNKEKDEQTTKMNQSGTAAVQVKKENVAIKESNKKEENVKTDTRLISTSAWWFLVVGGVITALLMWFSRRKK